MRRFIKAMGGELEIVARFPDHNVTIKNFHDLAEECLKQRQRLSFALAFATKPQAQSSLGSG